MRACSAMLPPVPHGDPSLFWAPRRLLDLQISLEDLGGRHSFVVQPLTVVRLDGRLHMRMCGREYRGRWRRGGLFLVAGDFWRGWLGRVLAQGFFDAPSAGACDALVDGQCLLHEGGGLAGVAVVEVGSAHSFQGACFFQGYAEFAG